MAEDPFSQAAWTRARDRFSEDLTEAERSIYHQSSLEMILYDASAAQKQHEGDSTSRHLMTKLQPLTSAIDQYGAALDVYVNAYPLALSPLWGSLRIVLQLAREFGKYFEKLVDMFERIGDLLPRFRAYERLFPNDERLVQSLSVVYVDILKFCSDVKSIFRRGKRASIINLKIFSKLVWKPFDIQFGESMRTFREHKKTVEKEAELSHMIESADSRQLVLANQLKLEQGKREEERHNMLLKLSCVSPEDLHRKQRRSYHEGTGMWALRRQESTIVEDLLSRETELGMTVTYFYCSYADTRTIEPVQIMGNLLRQLVVKGLTSEVVERDLHDMFSKGQHSLNEDNIGNVIRTIVKTRPKIWMVLDGIDECNDETRGYVLEFLISLIDCKGLRVRVLLTCRDEGLALKSVSHWPQIKLSQTALADDIGSFITSSVRTKIASGELKINKPALEKEVITALAAKAHGMFLWIHFQLIELCAATSPAQVRNVLENLPDGLGETYRRILLRVSSSSHQAMMARKIFMRLACARRPLRIEELQEAIAFETHDKAWDQDKIPDPDLMLQACQGLVVRDHEDEIVQFAHHTVQRYLVKDNDGPARVSRFASPASWGNSVFDFYFTMATAEQSLAELCIIYLSFTDFETAVVHRSSDLRFTPSGILGPGGPGTIPSVLGLGKPVLDVAYRILGGRGRQNALDVDYAQYLNLRPKAVNERVEEKHKLLNYIIEYWASHTKFFQFFQPGKSDLSYLFCQLVMYKTLPFEFRPWGPNRHFGPYGCKSCFRPQGDERGPRDLPFTSMIHWVAEVGHISILALMQRGATWTLKIVANQLYHERYSHETMLTACRNGRSEVVQLLALYYEYKLPNIEGLLMAACNSGHAHTLAILLRCCVLNMSGIEHICHSLLFKAASNGDVPVVQTLLLFEVYPEASDKLTKLTPLHSAAMNGHREVVDVLAPFYTSIDLEDEDSGATALHYAAEHGHVQITQTLIELGADLTRTNWERMTPLMLAVRAGYTDVVQCLVDAGCSVDIEGGVFEL